MLASEYKHKRAHLHARITDAASHTHGGINAIGEWMIELFVVVIHLVFAFAPDSSL